MELTKKERRLLSRKHNVAMLWIGIASILVSIALPILAWVKWKQADGVWQRNIAEVEAIHASATETECKLKESLVASMRALRDLDRKRVDQMAQKGFIMFSYLGLLGIGLYFRTRTWHRLIERLQSAQQVAPPASAT
jgi:hypothetical protein